MTLTGFCIAPIHYLYIKNENKMKGVIGGKVTLEYLRRLLCDILSGGNGVKIETADYSYRGKATLECLSAPGVKSKSSSCSCFNMQ